MSDSEEFKLSEEDRKRMESIIKRGQKIIFPERADQWEEFVKDSFKDKYVGKDAEGAVEIIEALNKGLSIDEAKKIVEKLDKDGINGAAYMMIRKSVLLFANNGPDFWKSTSKGHMSLRTRWDLFKIRRENTRLMKLHQYDLPPGEEPEQKESENKQSWVLSDDEMQIVTEQQSEIIQKNNDTKKQSQLGDVSNENTEYSK